MNMSERECVSADGSGSKFMNAGGGESTGVSEGME